MSFSLIWSTNFVSFQSDIGNVPEMKASNFCFSKTCCLFHTEKKNPFICFISSCHVFIVENQKKKLSHILVGSLTKMNAKVSKVFCRNFFQLFFPIWVVKVKVTFFLVVWLVWIFFLSASLKFRICLHIWKNDTKGHKIWDLSNRFHNIWTKSNSVLTDKNLFVNSLIWLFVNY